jgi:hypothetical protein
LAELFPEAEEPLFEVGEFELEGAFFELDEVSFEAEELLLEECSESLSSSGGGGGGLSKL